MLLMLRNDSDEQFVTLQGSLRPGVFHTPMLSRSKPLRPSAKETLEEMDNQLSMIRENLKKASDRQKSDADLKRTVRTFQAGDRVFLRVKPKGSSLNLGPCKKLAF